MPIEIHEEFIYLKKDACNKLIGLELNVLGITRDDKNVPQFKGNRVPNWNMMHW